MNITDLNNFYISDFNVGNILAVRQNREPGSVSSFLRTPRKSNGLLLITDYPALYQLPDGTPLRAEPGTLMFMPKGASYLISFCVPEGTAAHPILINFQLTDALGNEIVLGDAPLCLTRENSALLPLFHNAVALYRNAPAARLKETLYAIFNTVFPLTEEDPCCLNYIHRHYADALSIPALAKRCAMCETVYRKRFRQLTGTSPVQYINQLKIDKACQMLENGDISLQEISDFLHFYSVSYFCRVFKAITGTTPKAYESKTGLS